MNTITSSAFFMASGLLLSITTWAFTSQISFWILVLPNHSGVFLMKEWMIFWLAHQIAIDALRSRLLTGSWKTSLSEYLTLTFLEAVCMLTWLWWWWWCADFTISTYTFWVLSLLTDVDPQTRFECQVAVDKGDVQNWPVQLHHPSKLNVRINSSFLSELTSFFEGLHVWRWFRLQELTNMGVAQLMVKTFQVTSIQLIVVVW